MKKWGCLLLSSCMLLPWTSYPAHADSQKANSEQIKGNLVIAGGALERSNTSVYDEFVKLAGGKEKGKIGIVPAASGKLKSSYDFKEDLKKYGVSEKNIEILPLSNHDFSDTKEDESQWQQKANEEKTADRIKKLSAVWFVGGDQLQITNTLRMKNGKQTKALKAIWQIYRKGAVLGGTSAGAAIMSEVMLAGGDSLGALKGKFVHSDGIAGQKEYEPVYLTKGLGFFTYGIVDQHFDERARLGRLAMTALKAEKHKNQNFSYGIDEDTAMVVDNQKSEVRIVGRGGLTVLDVSKARKKPGKEAEVRNISLSLLSPGDKVNLKTRTIVPNPAKDTTKGYEYYNFKPLPATGVLTPYGRLKPYLAYSLADNSGAKSVTSYLYGSSGKGFKLTFKKTEEMNGYWGYRDGQKDDYSVLNTSLDISPVKLNYRKEATLFTDYKKPRIKLKELQDENGNKGKLVIVGGALGSSNKDVYSKFISMAGNMKEIKIGIVPAASSSLKSSDAFKNDLVSYGVSKDQVDILPISNHDFKGTETDESNWKENANSSVFANKLKGYSAIWFVGGDQTYITGSLLNTDGTDTKALQAIRSIYKNGAVLGGTSAGAAIMSNVMIAGGGSLETLTQGFTDKYDGMEQQEGGPGYLEQGLGFFPYGIVDQHFDQKARLGRLIAVAHEKGDDSQLSYGIDEDTALVIDNEKKNAEVAGRGGVTLVDLSAAKMNPKQPRKYKNIHLSKIAPGDSLNLETKQIKISSHKSLTTGNEYYDNQTAPHSGVLTPHGTWDKFLSYGLIDNAGERKLKSYSFKGNKGVQLTFKKTKETRGYWGYKDGGKDDYSVENVVLNIDPVRVSVK